MFVTRRRRDEVSAHGVVRHDRLGGASRLGARLGGAPRFPGAPRLRVALVAAIAVSTVLVSVVVPTPVSAAPATPTRACSGGTYTVVAGDGWSIIARRLSVTMTALLAANGATTATVIHPGRSVCIPAGATPTTSTAGSSGGSGAAGASSTATTPASCANGTYTIVRGDGWLAIAKKVGVTSKTLLAANNATTNTPLFAGRTVCLPAGAAPTASAGSTPTAVAVKAYSAAENEATIRAVWPDDLEEEALRIARRESNLKNNAKNSCCYGLFQINWNAHKSWLAGIGVTSAGQLLEPTVNTNAAYTLYQRSGSFRPWAL